MVMVREDTVSLEGHNRTEGTLPSAQKLTNWKKEPDVRTLKEDLAAAQSFHGAWVNKLTEWSNLHNIEGTEKPPKIKGRSRVQPKVVRRQAEWRYSALSEPFHGSDRLFDLYPRTFEDTPAARQNELVLNYQIDTKINKVAFIDEFVRTCVDEGTVIVRTGWERQSHIEKQMAPVWNYIAIPENDEETLNELVQYVQLYNDNRNEFLNLPENIQESVTYFLENNIPVVAQQVGEEEVEVEVVDENKPTIRFVNPRNFIYDPSCEGDLLKARFIINSFETSYAELKAAGVYKNLDQIVWDSAGPLAQPDHETTTPNEFQFKDKARKRVVAYEYWGYYDVDGDGKLTCILATWVGDVLIRMEKSPFPDNKPPFVLVPYLPIKRSVYGEPDAELLGDNQRILGAVVRGSIDLLGRSANSQQGFAKGFLDPINRKRFDDGQDYEFNPTTAPEAAIHMHKYPELPQSALTIYEMQNAEAEALTGVKSFTGGMSGNAYGDVAAGIRGMLDASAKREMNILRRLAEGIKEIGNKIVAMNGVFLREEEVIRITNKEFVTVRREDLKGNFDIIVDISTAEIDQMKSQDLGFLLQTIGPGLDWNITRMILAEITRLKRMPDLSEAISRFEPQPDPLEEARKQLEIEELQYKIEELKSRIALNHAKAKEASSSADLKDLDFVEQETGTKHARDMDKQSAQAEANQNLAVTKGILDAASKESTKSPDRATTEAIGFNQISKAMNSRDPANNIGSRFFDPSLDPSLNPRLNRL